MLQMNVKFCFAFHSAFTLLSHQHLLISPFLPLRPPLPPQGHLKHDAQLAYAASPAKAVKPVFN